MTPRARSPNFAAAFSLAALLLYLPANVFPILRMNLYGATTDNTVWQGCVRFYEDGDYVIALIVLLASMVIPLIKLLGLLFLAGCQALHVSKWRAARNRIYRVIDAIGRWAMLDIFGLAVLVSLVKLERLATIAPGPGALPFALVVVFTMLASQAYKAEPE